MKKQLLACDGDERLIWIELPGEIPISRGIAEWFCRALARLNRRSHEPIRMYLSGRGGGDFFACLKMVQEIDCSPSPVVIIGFGALRSGSFLITQAGRLRYALPGAWFQFHHATDYYVKGRSDVWGMSQKDYWQKMERLRLIDAVQMLLFTRNGRPVSAVFRAFEREERLTVSRARFLRLIDGTYCRKEFERMHACARACVAKRR